MPATQKKKKSGSTEKEKASKAASQKAKPKGKTSEKDTARTHAADNVTGRADQVGSILHKSLDLVETGLGLGINLITKFGSVAQEQIVEKISGMQTTVTQHGPKPEQQCPEEQGFAGEVQDEKTGFHVVNRLPLFPGSKVSVPFSINNDSASSAKKLKLHVEFPLGEAYGIPSNSKMLSIKPAEVEIAPMDFEKLVLTGTIPPGAPAGQYSGWIVITGDEQFKIPATLTVAKKES